METLRVIFREESFAGVNANDAAAAFKVLGQTVGRIRGYEVVPEVSVVGTESEYLAALKSGAFDLAVVDPWVYVQHQLEDVVRLDFAAEDGAGVHKQFVVLSRSDSGITNLASLAGRSLMTLRFLHADLGRRWLDTALLEAGWGSVASHLKEVETAIKPAGVVLPVFFGKRDVALVDAGNFRTMVELNPQVGKTVRPIQTSPPLPNVTVGTRAGPWESEAYRSAVVEAMGDLASTPAGRQVLVLFKIKALVPVPVGYLDGVRAMQRVRGMTGSEPTKLPVAVVHPGGS
ncbi:MAG: PhnD/SsuA/transferrin family substrate-binding protein [Verrucomicrobiales bacterium]|nr:PhnD/SsuA/transferrin family substrate-binding protein [Verrucomicrobiales bacterium]